MSESYTKIKRTKLNEEIFKAVLKCRGECITSLGNPERKDHPCSVRCLHDSLKKGEIKDSFLTDIAKLINVDKRFLSGELYNSRYKHTSLDYYLSQINQYPYAREELEKVKIQYPINILDTVLVNFNLNIDQFDSLSIGVQNALYGELLSGIRDTLVKYMPVDDITLNGWDFLIQDCFMSAEVHNKILPKFLHELPDGYSPEDIESMDDIELYHLYMFLEHGVELA